MGQKILITGASGGFGQLTVKSLLDAGNQVVASMRNINGKNKAIAEEMQNWGAKIVEIDVTNEASVQEGVAKSIELLGGLDVLINNAGVGTLGMVEHFTAEDFQKLFDINVFGVQRMNRAVLPYFRQQQNGLIIYISSLLGRITMPFYGAYNASKWALEALAENYCLELSGFGVENCIVEPGGYPTTFMENLLKPSDHSQVASYGEFMNFPAQMLSGFEQALHANPEQKPQKVADTIVNLIALKKGEKPFRTTVDSMGMGNFINPYNQQLEQIMQGLLGNFGIGGMLKVK
ncbi:MAG: oxidoreductase [Flammeovirgaceae bacterium]